MISISTKPHYPLKLQDGSLRIEREPGSNKVLLRDLSSSNYIWINPVTGENNLAINYDIVYNRIEELRKYVTSADTSLQGQINDIIDEIGTIDGSTVKHSEEIKKLQEELLKAFDELEGIHSTNENLQEQIDADKQHLSEYKLSTDSMISEINQQIISDKTALESRIENTEQNIIDTEQRLTEDITSSEQKISNLQNEIDADKKLLNEYKTSSDSTFVDIKDSIEGLQITTSSLSKNMSDNTEAFSNYKSTTDSTIKGIQTTNENLQQQITENAETFSDYKSSTDSTIKGIQTINENLQQQIDDTNTNLSSYKSSTNSTITGIQTTNTNLQKQIDDDKEQLSNYISSTNSTISGIKTTNENLQKQITNNKSSLEKSIAENKNDISAVNSSLSSYKSSTNNTISGIQSTNSNLQKQIDDTNTNLSSYKTATDSTIAGIQTTNTNLQQQITDNAETFSDYKTTTDSTIAGIQTTNTNLQEQITDNASAFSEYKTTTDNTINGIQTTNTNLQQQITDTNTILTEYKSSTNNTLSGINTEITNLKSITGTDGTEISNLKKITVSLSDDVASIETNIGTHASKIETLENGIKQKADISALTTMEARINDNIDVKIDNVVSVTNTIETNIKNIDGKIVNINNEITNQITINNNINSTISNVQSEVASIQNNIGDKPSSGTIWGNINTLNNKTACITGSDSTATEIRTKTLKGPNGANFDMATSGFPRTDTMWVGNEMAMAGLLKLSSSYPGSPTGSTSHTSASRSKIAQTIGTYDILNTLTNIVTQLNYMTGLNFVQPLANQFTPADILFLSQQSEIDEIKMYIKVPNYESCTIELGENNLSGGYWYNSAFTKKRIKFYRMNNCVWFSNSESEMYYFMPKQSNTESEIIYKPNKISYDKEIVSNYAETNSYSINMYFPTPKTYPNVDFISLNRLVPRAGFSCGVVENEFNAMSIPAVIPEHCHFLTQANDKSGLCTWDVNENANNNGSSVKYTFIGARSSSSYLSDFNPCSNICSGIVAGSTSNNITIPANPTASFKAYILVCVYKIPLADKNKSIQDIIRYLYSHISNWSTAGKNITYTGDNPWGDRAADDIFV